MSNYIPHHTEKKQTLSRKEDFLRRLVIQNASQERILAAVEEVRDARIRVVRAQRATITPTADGQVKYDKLDARIQGIATTPLETIVAEFVG